jgi:hypothetical protein
MFFVCCLVYISPGRQGVCSQLCLAHVFCVLPRLSDHWPGASMPKTVRLPSARTNPDRVQGTEISSNSGAPNYCTAH